MSNEIRNIWEVPTEELSPEEVESLLPAHNCEKSGLTIEQIGLIAEKSIIAASRALLCMPLPAIDENYSPWDRIERGDAVYDDVRFVLENKGVTPIELHWYKLDKAKPPAKYTHADAFTSKSPSKLIDDIYKAELSLFVAIVSALRPWYKKDIDSD